jgi:hypothetical protein
MLAIIKYMEIFNQSKSGIMVHLSVHERFLWVI